MSQCFILAENQFESATTVLASSETAGFPGRCAWDGVTTTYWQPVGTGVHTLTAVFSAPVAVDTFCCFIHNLGTAGGSIGLQYSSDGGSTWTDAFVELSPADNTCVMQRFSSISADHWRVIMTITTAPVFLGVVAFGTAINTYRGMPIGFVRPADSRISQILPNTTEGGAIAGRSVIPQGAEFSIMLKYIPWAWIVSTWRAFIKRAEGHPFFFSWNYGSYPLETVYGMLKPPIAPPTNGEYQTYDISVVMDCLLGAGGGA